MLRIISKISPADFITLGNALCAIVAITFFIDARGAEITNDNVYSITIGCTLLLFSMILDGLDGIVARKFGSNHQYGAHLDSISDTFSFCIAPGILIYCTYFRGDIDNSLTFLIIGAMALAILFGIFRLVVFTKEGHKHKNFFGIPTPVNAAFIIIMCYFYVHYKAGNMDDIFVLKQLTSAITSPPQSLILFGMVSFMMVTNFKYIKVRGRKAVLTGLIVLIMLVLVLLSIQDITCYFIPQYILFSVVVCFIIVNPILDMMDKSENGFMARSKQQWEDRKENVKVRRVKIKQHREKRRAERAKRRRNGDRRIKVPKMDVRKMIKKPKDKENGKKE